MLLGLPVAIYATDASGVITFYNPAAAALWGREPEIGKDLWCGSWRIYNLHGDPVLLEECPMAITLREGREVRDVEIIVERPDGVRKRVLPFPVPLRDANGFLIGATNTLIDISGRASQEEASRQLAAIVASSEDAIVSKNLHGVIMSWNRGAERIFGYTEQEAVGQSIMMIIPPDRASEERSILRRIGDGELIQHFETLRRRKDGTLVPISLTVSPVKDTEGRIVGASKIARDITEQVRIKRELELARDDAQAASHAKDDFFAALSHELRTPLNPVLLVASEARDNPALPADVREDFEMIHNNVNLEARLIDDMLDLTRISRGKLDLGRSLLVLDALLRDATSMIQGEILEKGVQLSLDLRAGGCGLIGDSVRLQQAYWNILRNAVKFTPKGGTVTVASDVDPATQSYRVRISDTGIGMSPKEQERIFEPFTQGDHATRGHARTFGGLGLGLAISQHLIRLHGGRIRASSPGLGAGSTFTIELPYTVESLEGRFDSPPEPQIAEIAAASSNAARSLTILLVDDHEPTCLVLSRFLRRLGHRTLVAQTVGEAMAVAAANNLDLLVSDIGLPDGNGYELMAELRRRQPGLCGIAISGYGMADDIARSRNAGFIEHCTKPIRIEVLESVLARIEQQVLC